jgi:hypothetical protein
MIRPEDLPETAIRRIWNSTVEKSKLPVQGFIPFRYCSQLRLLAQEAGSRGGQRVPPVLREYNPFFCAWDFLAIRLRGSGDLEGGV